MEVELCVTGVESELQHTVWLVSVVQTGKLLHKSLQTGSVYILDTPDCRKLPFFDFFVFLLRCINCNKTF